MAHCSTMSTYIMRYFVLSFINSRCKLQSLYFVGLDVLVYVDVLSFSNEMSNAQYSIFQCMFASCFMGYVQQFQYMSLVDYDTRLQYRQYLEYHDSTMRLIQIKFSINNGFTYCQTNIICILRIV